MNKVDRRGWQKLGLLQVRVERVNNGIGRTRTCSTLQSGDNSRKNCSGFTKDEHICDFFREGRFANIDFQNFCTVLPGYHGEVGSRLDLC